MPEFAPTDWDALTALALRLGLPDERVAALRRRLDPSYPRPGVPYTLVAGRPDAGIELLLGRWLGPEVADALLAAGGKPLVVGPTPGEVRPKLGAWPGYAKPAAGSGHLVVVRSAGKPAADVLAQLGSVGYFDKLVLVTRLAQPFHASERELAQSLSGLAAAAQVLVVAVPGEEPSADDLAEVCALGVAQTGQAGFDAGRSLGAAVWFTGKERPPGTLEDVGSYVGATGADTAAAHAGMTRRAVRGLLADLRQRAEAAPAPSAAAVPEDEQDRLTRELTGYLADLGRDLDRQVAGGRATTSDRLRTHAADVVRGWGAYVGIEGHWLKYVDRLRPGAHAALLEEVRAAVSTIEYDPGRPADPGRGPAAAPDWFTARAMRAGIGLAAGVGSYILVSVLLTRVAAVALPDIAVTLLSSVALVAVGVVAYSVSRRWFPDPTLEAVARAAAVAPPDPGAPPGVLGWQSAERRVAAWFREFIRARPASPADECRALAVRFGIPEYA